MTFAYTQDEFIMGLGTDTVVSTGTFTNTSGGTGGAITVQGVKSVRFFSASPTVNATAIYYSASDNAVTIVTGSNEVGTWICIGSAS